MTIIRDKHLVPLEKGRPRDAYDEKKYLVTPLNFPGGVKWRLIRCAFTFTRALSRKPEAYSMHAQFGSFTPLFDLPPIKPLIVVSNYPTRSAQTLCDFYHGGAGVISTMLKIFAMFQGRDFVFAI